MARNSVRKRPARNAPRHRSPPVQPVGPDRSARDILRKDKGLNGDLDRLPLLTWVMFLKFLDDLESGP
jgi:type I restriction enzyme M protein